MDSVSSSAQCFVFYYICGPFSQRPRCLTNSVQDTPAFQKMGTRVKLESVLFYHVVIRQKDEKVFGFFLSAGYHV